MAINIAALQQTSPRLPPLLLLFLFLCLLIIPAESSSNFLMTVNESSHSTTPNNNNQSILVTGDLILPLATFWRLVVTLLIPALSLFLLVGCLVLEPLCSRYDGQLLSCTLCQLVANSALSQAVKSPSPSSSSAAHPKSPSSFDAFCRRLSTVFQEQEQTVRLELSGRENQEEGINDKSAVEEGDSAKDVALLQGRRPRPHSAGSLASHLSFDSFRRAKLASGVSSLTLAKFTFDDSRLFRGPETPTSKDDPLKVKWTTS